MLWPSQGQAWKGGDESGRELRPPVAAGRADLRFTALRTEAGLQRVKESAVEGGRKAEQHAAIA